MFRQNKNILRITEVDKSDNAYSGLTQYPALCYSYFQIQAEKSPGFGAMVEYMCFVLSFYLFVLFI